MVKDREAWQAAQSTGVWVGHDPAGWKQQREAGCRPAQITLKIKPCETELSHSRGCHHRGQPGCMKARVNRSHLSSIFLPETCFAEPQGFSSQPGSGPRRTEVGSTCWESAAPNQTFVRLRRPGSPSPLRAPGTNPDQKPDLRRLTRSEAWARPSGGCRPRARPRNETVGRNPECSEFPGKRTEEDLRGGSYRRGGGNGGGGLGAAARRAAPQWRGCLGGYQRPCGRGGGLEDGVCSGWTQAGSWGSPAELRGRRQVFKSAASPGMASKSRGAEGKGRWKLGAPLREETTSCCISALVFPLNSCTPCRPLFWGFGKTNKTKNKTAFLPLDMERFGVGPSVSGTFLVAKTFSKRQTLLNFALTGLVFDSTSWLPFSCSLLFVKAPDWNSTEKTGEKWRSDRQESKVEIKARIWATCDSLALAF